METPQVKTGRIQIERHLQTILLTLITSAVVAGVSKLYNMSESLARMEEREKAKGAQIENLQRSLDIMQTDVKDLQNRMIKLEAGQAK